MRTSYDDRCFHSGLSELLAEEGLIQISDLLGIYGVTTCHSGTDCNRYDWSVYFTLQFHFLLLTVQ